MQRYFIHLAFDGGEYHGWQIQPNGNTVEETLERGLSLLLREKVDVVGAGRTDAGVNARLMVAHFDTEQPFDCGQLSYRLNKLLPRDISIYRIEPVEAGMHARFSARWRTYHYYIHTRKDPFARYSCFLGYPLDFEKMNEAAAFLLQVDDFAAFCKAHADVGTTLCNVVEARWIKVDEAHWYFRIKANRFLRNMVRAVVGSLVDVGRGRLSLEGFRAVVAGGNRSAAGESMPGEALFLENIEY